MSHDVFISYSNKDKPIADAVCAKLEARKIRCWIAPRDVPPGANFAGSIVDAIDNCKMFILIWSANTNQSEHILNELNQAFDDGTPVIPFRIENVEPSKSLKYYIGRTHWLDAMTPPLEKHINTLADVILTNLGRKSEIKPYVPIVEKPVAEKREEVIEEKKRDKAKKAVEQLATKPRVWWPYLAGLIGVVAVVGLGLTLFKQPAQPTLIPSTIAPVATVISSQSTNIPLETISAISSLTPINLTKNQGDDYNPSWSAGGKMIAIGSNRDRNAEIYMMNADGSSPINLTYNPADDNHPTWSADEQKIAFQSDRDGNNEVYVLNTDDRSLMNLTNNPADDQRPAWSSDEKKIAFQSDRDGNNEIYVMNADGSNPIKLTNNPADDQSPAWSADGQKIAFQSDRDGNNEIYVMNADGSQPIKLTNNPNNDNQPTWSSDGKKIAFQSDRDGNNEIYLMNADGSNPINLTNNLAADKSPAWSFNGNKIAFASDRDGNYEIYVMSADGSRPIQSTEIPIQPTTIKAEYQTQDLGNPDYQTSFARSAFDSQEWPTRDSKGAKLFWGEDNTYIFDIQPPSVSITALYLDGKKKFINSIVEVDVKFSDKEGEVGIVCRGYKAIFNSNGRTTISLINNPYNYTYLFSNDSEIIKEIGKYYRLRFDCIGQLLTVYENGVKIGEVQDNKFIAGSVGLIVRPNNSFHVAFDNFKLWLP